MKPSPPNFQELYLASLEHLGIDTKTHDIRFVEDNWESPTLGAWGLGWEVWMDGMEITQFTYFQQVGGLECYPVMGEITYGLERLALYIQGVEDFKDLVWTENGDKTITYADVYHQYEVEMSRFNFDLADVDALFAQFDFCEKGNHSPTRSQLTVTGLRIRHEGFTCLQSSGFASRHFGHRAPKVYFESSSAVPRGRAKVL